MWTTAVGALTGAVWLNLLPDGPAPTAVKWALLSAWVAVSAIIIRYFGSLQHVWRKGDELIIGDARRGLRVHLGDSISFVPKGAGPFFFPLMTSPVAERLRERHHELAAEQHRRVGRG